MESTHNSNHEQHSNEQALESNANMLAATAQQEEHRRLFKRGMSWMCVGVVLMGLSFLINFVLFHSDQSFVTIMYVMTSLGTLCIVKSLADILGF